MTILDLLPVNDHLFVLDDDPSQEELETVETILENLRHTFTHGEYNQPGIDISLVIKDAQGIVLGGVVACTVFHFVHLDVLWVPEEYRLLGLGSQLVFAAEQVGFSNGCNTSQTWTLSFQGPEFYPTIGYEQIGTYDGYPNGITEHAYLKRLDIRSLSLVRIEVPDARGFYLTADVTRDDLKVVQAGLHRHVLENVGEEYKGVRIKLALRDQAGQLAGGLCVWTTLSNVIFEYVWIKDAYRSLGMARRLMQEMEKLALAYGCIASQAHCFSFEAPGFFEKMGYAVLGVSDGYPPPFREFYMIKKYQDKLQ